MWADRRLLLGLFALNLSATIYSVAGLPQQLVLTVPPAGTTTDTAWVVGYNSSQLAWASGYARNASLALTFPNGTTTLSLSVGVAMDPDWFVGRGCPLGECHY